MKLVILDRDGVINQDSDNYVRSLEEWIPLPGSIDAIARLSQGGYTVVVATNQSGLARGYFSESDLEAMNAKLTSLVESAGGRLAGIYVCPHGPDDYCGCRKPAPGLLDTISADFGGIDIAGTPIIGDSLRDLEAGIARGCLPILVRTGKGKAAEEKLGTASGALAHTLIFDDLAAVTDYLFSGQEQLSP